MPSPSELKFRYAVMCNSRALKKWQAACVQKLSEAEIAEPVLLIINESISARKNFLSRLSSYPFKHAIYRIYYRFFIKPEMQKEQALPTDFKGIEQINCTVKKNGYSEYFEINDIERIRKHNLDFILRFGFNIIRGEILDAAKYGIWSFHHDDELKYRGGPFGFWEIFKNDPVNAVVLQKLTEKLDSGIILKKYFLKTILHSYQGNINSLLFHCGEMPLQVCKDIANGCLNPDLMEPSKTSAPVYKIATNSQMLLFLLKSFYKRILFHFNELLCSESWETGITKTTLSEVALGCRKHEFNWLKNNNATIFKADPFIYERNGKIAVIYERFDYKQKKGSICRAYFNNDNKLFSDEQILLEGTHHLAYPFIFQENSDIYCIPEESELKRIAIYKLNDKTEKFEFSKILVRNIDAVDSSLIKYNGKWWLFFTCKSSDTNTKLFIFHSEQFDGNYLPHQNNPVKSDIRSSRPAGSLFIHKGDLYRPSQDSAKHYGHMIRINKVTKLTETEFSETEVSEIIPEAINKKFTGTHTISGYGEYTAIDAKRYRFIFHSFKSHLRNKIHNLFKIKKIIHLKYQK